MRYTDEQRVEKMLDYADKLVHYVKKYSQGRYSDL